MFIYTEFQAEEDISDILEETFDTCGSNREEIYWLITVLRGFMGIPNKRTDYNQDNFKLNQWQLELYPVFQRYKKKYWSLPYKPPFDDDESNELSSNKGGHWFNDGITQIFQSTCPVGFKRGMLKKRKQ